MKRVKYSIVVEVKDNVDLVELNSHIHGGISFIKDEGHLMDDYVDFSLISTDIKEL